MFLARSCSNARATDPLDCGAARSAFVLVDTTSHRLGLCQGGRSSETLSVRIGRGGVGKHDEGDGKTPLGRYGLGEPRPSELFGTFVPIAYPTPEQRAAGFTGGAVGIHGPNRRVRWLGRAVNWFDTTEGCVGLATDDEIERVASWIGRQHAVEVLIR
jgi:murein L,D-transpeptidase YafK